ncbi:hypothetical protein NB724_002023 [Pantoea ananatis]|nr:hypothetical protein [Pantoea ananatis]MCW0316872.1 hypothetical protein [Pantoea ananatis]MCW0334927.1 hypothetical protein [Pantoea ananatis]MCW0383537.1 hypothetical protein [Pantoea ananatis]MCW0408101.1 hypothetical protein [Pantoea ananatis]MCW0428304.1 hypothetical protein [Pantoea ananatis]
MSVRIDNKKEPIAPCTRRIQMFTDFISCSDIFDYIKMFYNSKYRHGSSY